MRFFYSEKILIIKKISTLPFLKIVLRNEIVLYTNITFHSKNICIIL